MCVWLNPCRIVDWFQCHGFEFDDSLNVLLFFLSWFQIRDFSRVGSPSTLCLQSMHVLLCWQVDKKLSFLEIYPWWSVKYLNLLCFSIAKNGINERHLNRFKATCFGMCLLVKSSVGSSIPQRGLVRLLSVATVLQQWHYNTATLRHYNTSYNICLIKLIM